MGWFFAELSGLGVEIHVAPEATGELGGVHGPVVGLGVQVGKGLEKKIRKKNREIVWCSGAFHRGAFCQFPFRWIYYYGSNKSTGKEIGKMHLCALRALSLKERLC